MNSPNSINWIQDDVVLAIHDAQLAEHGGDSGIRDPGLLDSALSRPKNAATYSNPTIPELAALYAHSIATNHPFVDGNKRVAAVLLETFLEDNGFELAAKDVDLYNVMMALAKSEISDAAFTKWVVEHSRTFPV